MAKTLLLTTALVATVGLWSPLPAAAQTPQPAPPLEPAPPHGAPVNEDFIRRYAKLAIEPYFRNQTVLIQTGQRGGDASSSKWVLVAVRGTDFASIKDVATDISSVAAVNPCSGFAEVPQGEVKGRVGAGWKSRVSGDWERLLQAVSPSHGEFLEAAFVGHSLGAGAATVMAYCFKKRYPKIRVLVAAFNSPAVGDAAFNNDYNAIIDENHHFLRHGDPFSGLRVNRAFFPGLTGTIWGKKCTTGVGNHRITLWIAWATSCPDECAADYSPEQAPVIASGTQLIRVVTDAARHWFEPAIAATTEQGTNSPVRSAKRRRCAA